MLPYSASAVSHLLEELEEHKKLLDYRGPLPRTWSGRLRRDLEAEAVAASTAMEGVPVTVEEVLRILAGVHPPGVDPHDVELVRGYRQAVEFALRRADDPSFRWDRELLVALHDRILAGRFPEGAGRLRTGMALVVDGRTGTLIFTPPQPDEVPGLVDRAMDRMESQHDHPALAAAWVHIAIAAIHPFRDGNGRTARTCATLAMLRGGFKLPEFTSLEEWWGRHRSDYYGAFTFLGDRFDEDVDVTPFVRAHIEAQLHQVRALDLRERVQRQVWYAIEEAATERGLDPRVANAAWDVFFGRVVTRNYYREVADVQDVTASTDLKGLVTAGFLRPEGAGRSRRYVAADGLYEGVARRLGVAVDAIGDDARMQLVAVLTERVRWEAEERAGLTKRED